MKNKLLLINPEINPKTQKKFITAVVRASFPFSLGHLAGYLLRNGDYPLEIIDDQIDPISDERLVELIDAMDRPRIVGITALTSTSARAYQLARDIKKIDPSVVVVLGGVHISVMTEEALTRSGADIAVRGEGEVTLEEIIQRVEKGQDWRGVAGISYLKDGRMVNNPDRPLLEDLDALPAFPFHLFDKNIHKYPGFHSVQTSRGCPYGCTFCSQRSITGRSYRYVSTERALNDIKYLADRYGATLIRLMDDNIGANRKRLMALLDGIVAEGLHRRVAFEAPMRGDNLTAEVLDRLKEANFTLLTFGLETVSESLMRKINKGETVEDVLRAIRMTSEKGISTGTTLIFGLPGETARDRRDAVRVVSGLPLDSVRFNILTPYPGTPVYDEIVGQGRLVRKDNWENFSVQYMWEGDDLPYVPDGTDRYELMFAAMWANLWFYIRPSGLWKLLTRRAAGGNVIMLKKRWYFSPFLFKVLRVASYLTWRFGVVAGKTFLRKLKPGARRS